eukprot:CAMPEP_0185491218 /NCGR_PEP_ID=MMETSP1366-20130426/14530_1 /TAXON_ID=38817 /ORGANISM="Gephyrocapsa oceanica, Strain RCC1303" /LENGTH=245 /DNA_ID=CAMNT_0028099961 /DNA_START=103 /DNA_END=837 /DNA_ORIENTATION=-
MPSSVRHGGRCIVRDTSRQRSAEHKPTSGRRAALPSGVDAAVVVGAVVDAPVVELEGVSGPHAERLLCDGEHLLSRHRLEEVQVVEALAEAALQVRLEPVLRELGAQLADVVAGDERHTASASASIPASSPASGNGRRTGICGGGYRDRGRRRRERQWRRLALSALHGPRVLPLRPRLSEGDVAAALPDPHLFPPLLARGFSAAGPFRKRAPLDWRTAARRRVLHQRHLLLLAPRVVVRWRAGAL